MGEPAMKVVEHFTYKDVKSWPEGERWEIIRGQAFQISSPKIVHQRALGQLYRQMGDFFEGKPCEPLLGPVDVLFRENPEQDEDQVDTMLIPDLVVVCDETRVSERFIDGAPDWVLEVLSPSTSWRDLTEKREIYERHGVKEYWVLNPENLDLTIFRGERGQFGAPIGASLKEVVPVSLFPGLVLTLRP